MKGEKERAHPSLVMSLIRDKRYFCCVVASIRRRRRAQLETYVKGSGHQYGRKKCPSANKRSSLIDWVSFGSSKIQKRPSSTRPNNSHRKGPTNIYDAEISPYTILFLYYSGFLWLTQYNSMYYISVYKISFALSKREYLTLLSFP